MKEDEKSEQSGERSVERINFVKAESDLEGSTGNYSGKERKHGRRNER